MSSPSVLAIIPARGGSLRLPRKNILPFAGKPLIAWSIEAALASDCVSKVAISTDDDEIAKVAQEYGAEVPFLRPPELATNTATTVDVLLHAVKFYENIKEKFDYIAVLQPTSPLRTSKHIDEAFQLLLKKDADAVVGVCELDYPIEWCNAIPDDLSLTNFLPETIKNKRSQDFIHSYRPNGCIFIVRKDEFLLNKEIYLKNNIYAYIMDRKSSVDIDTIDDFHLAECLGKKLLNNKT